MKRLIDTTEVIGTVESNGLEYELCARAEAAYDEEKGQLSVTLDSCLRPTDIRVKDISTSAAWLPKGDTIRETVSYSEGTMLAREIFHRWVRKVRESAPALHSPTV